MKTAKYLKFKHKYEIYTNGWIMIKTYLIATMVFFSVQYAFAEYHVDIYDIVKENKVKIVFESENGVVCTLITDKDSLDKDKEKISNWLKEVRKKECKK